MASAPHRPFVPNTPWRTFQEPSAPASSGSSLGGTLGALAIVVGLGAIGAYMLDLHGHTCDRCGRRWRHFGAFNLGDESSHTCAGCGAVQWWKCGAPHVLRGSEYTPTPAPPMPMPHAAFPASPPFAQFAPPAFAPGPMSIAMGGYAAPTGLPAAPPSSGAALMRRPR